MRLHYRRVTGIMKPAVGGADVCFYLLFTTEPSPRKTCRL